MSESEKLEILKEIRDNQKEAIDIQKQQFAMYEKQYDRAEKIQDKAEILQNNASRSFKFILPVIFLLLALVCFMLWQSYR